MKLQIVLETSEEGGYTAWVPSLPYDKVINALKRDGWVVVRQRGSHIRLQKRTRTDLAQKTAPDHPPSKPTQNPV